MTDLIGSWIGEWASTLTAGAVLLRLGISLLLSAVIGWERASKRHSAGLGTFILVCLGSTTAALVDCFMLSQEKMILPILSASVLVGVGILSISSVLYSSKSQIKGLTTAVGLWACSTMGIAIGIGFYTASLGAFACILLCLHELPVLERYLKDRSNHFEIHLELTDRRRLQDFITTLRRLGIRIDDIESNPAYIRSGLSVYSISLTITREELERYKAHSDIIKALSTLEYVSYIEEI